MTWALREARGVLGTYRLRGGIGADSKTKPNHFAVRPVRLPSAPIFNRVWWRTAADRADRADSDLGRFQEYYGFPYLKHSEIALTVLLPHFLGGIL